MLNQPSSLSTGSIPKPYCSVGAGRLTSFLFKEGDPRAGWQYSFNLFCLTDSGGRATQLFAPTDLTHFLKLVQVLASVIADDGCLASKEREQLLDLAANLNDFWSRETTSDAEQRTQRGGSRR